MGRSCVPRAVPASGRLSIRPHACHLTVAFVVTLYSPDPTNLVFFVTAPFDGPAQPTRGWVLGDSGTANSSAAAVRDAHSLFAGSRYTEMGAYSKPPAGLGATRDFHHGLPDAGYRLQAGSPTIDAGGASFERQGETVLSLPSSLYLGNAPELELFELDRGGGLRPEVTGIESRLSSVLAVTVPVTTAVLVRTTALWALSPPSPDSTGITYITHKAELLVSDSEVNEIPAIFNVFGVNLFPLSLFGAPVPSAGVTTAFSNEPTGVSYNPVNHHLFVSDDDLREVFELDPGADGLYGTADDPPVTQFDTMVHGNADPEGVAYNPDNGHLYVADGVGTEVYDYDPGPDGQ